MSFVQNINIIFVQNSETKRSAKIVICCENVIVKLLIIVKTESYLKMRANIQNIILTIIVILSSSTIFSQKNEPYRLKKVVIDAGHGGKDPGAVGKKSYEKDITLKLALKLGQYIKTNLPDVEVIYTRKTDVFVELNKRSEVANTNNADLFISIHVDANTNTKATGTSTYVMGLNRANENLEVVKRENAVVKLEKNYKSNYSGFDPDAPESEIVFSLYQNAYLDNSIRLAERVQKQLEDRASRKNRGVRQAGLIVLWNCTMPSILIETGFITNLEEEKFLMSEEGQNLIASAIFRSFRDYKNELEKKSPTTKEEIKPKNDSQTVVKTEVKTDTKKTDSKTTVKPAGVKSAVAYKIQIAFSERKLETLPQNFKGISGVERSAVGQKFRYTVGTTTSFTDISEQLKTIKAKIPDAYIIAFHNGEVVPVVKALELQKNEKK